MNIPTEVLRASCERYLSGSDPLDFVAVPDHAGSMQAGPRSYGQRILDMLQGEITSVEGLLRALNGCELMAVYDGAQVVADHGEPGPKVCHDSLVVEPGEVVLVSGDLQAASITNGGILVVLGSLYTREYDDFDDQPTLVVLGDVVCQSAWVGGGMAVGRVVTVERVVCGWGHGDAIIANEVKTELLLLQDKTLLTQATLAKAMLDSRAFDEEDLEAWRGLTKVFVPELLPILPADEDDGDAWAALEELDFPLDLDAVRQRACSGMPLVKDPSG